MKDKYLSLFIIFAVCGAILIAITAIGGTDIPSFNTDDIFNLPIPNTYGETTTLPTSEIELVAIVIAIILILLATFMSIKKISLFPLCLMLSFFLMFLGEAFIDILIGIWQFELGDNIVFNLFGRPVPFTNLVLFATIFAILGTIYGNIVFRLLKNNCTTKALWTLIFSVVGVNIALEEIMLSLVDFWEYYGNQPLIFIDIYPMYIGFMVSGGFFCVSAFAYKYQEAFHGWKSITLLVLVPAIFNGMVGFAAVPASIAVNSLNMPWIGVQLLGLLTIGLALVYSGAFMKFILGRDPIDFKARQ